MSGACFCQPGPLSRGLQQQNEKCVKENAQISTITHNKCKYRKGFSYKRLLSVNSLLAFPLPVAILHHITVFFFLKWFSGLVRNYLMRTICLECSFIKQTKCAYNKHISTLLHVSARLCLPQGIHTPNLAVVKYNKLYP